MRFACTASALHYSTTMRSTNLLTLQHPLQHQMSSGRRYSGVDSPSRTTMSHQASYPSSTISVSTPWLIVQPISNNVPSSSTTTPPEIALLCSVTRISASRRHRAIRSGLLPATHRREQRWGIGLGMCRAWTFGVWDPKMGLGSSAPV